MTVINTTPGVGADDGRWNNSAAGGQTSFYANTESAIAIGSTAAGFDFISAFIRFPSIQFSGTPTISSAILTLNFDGTAANGSPVFTVCAVKSDNPAAPTTSADARGRSLTTATVSWTPTASSANDTLDITSVLNEIVGAFDYVSSSKGIVVYILASGVSSVQRRFAAQNSGSNIPALAITYAAGGGGGGAIKRVLLSGGIRGQFAGGIVG